MKLFFTVLALILFVLYLGVDTDRVSVSVKEGDSVTLHTGVKTHKQEDIKWYFSSIRIAQISGDLSDICTDVQCNEDVPAAKLYEVKEGESVTLDSGVTKHPNDVMTWYFNEILISEITGGQSKICTDVQCDERFRDRLKLDHQTGSLTITNTRNTDSGEYKLKITINNSSFSITTVKRFNVTATAVPDSGLSSGVEAAIVVAVVLLVAAVTVGVIYCRRRSHTAVPKNEDDDGNSPPDPNDISLRGDASIK
ncbi:hypothetical protein DPX16_0402 [Anabarilius grahami]|uniref:Ig-like domain-containing protein n=1 Tax=Anabarilius grahami TaxID=495550 RepID=A0A3N0YFI2_ANAGA|nr:hypothetical protein DPX16_0402 [Anabarilius grahami]